MAFDKQHSRNQAQTALQQGRPQHALPPLWQLIDRSHLVEEEFEGFLRMMMEAYRQLGRGRAAATIALHLGDPQSAYNFSESPTDRARVHVKVGRAQEAAKAYNDAGWLGHAAIQLESAKDDRGARVLWERLADDVRLRDDLYTQGLVRFNLGRACERLGDKTAARKAVVQSMHLLEAAADGFETRGLRERAFDCYQVLLTLGREGAFENLAEGYLNCIRILAEDNLKYYVIQYYEDFQALAVERGELHAAATLFREAAEFARRFGMPYEGQYRLRAAQTQVAAAERMVREGSLHEMAENAYAAAIDAYNDLGQYSMVRQIYAALATLELGDKRRARYLRLEKRLEGVGDEPMKLEKFPDYLRVDTAYPPIWHLDVIEFEQDGDPAETMGEVLLEDKWPDFTKRRALICRLKQLQEGDGPYHTETLVDLAQHLGRVEIYAALSPLEHMAEHEEPRVRAACLKAVRNLFFKRSFVLVMRGLDDEDGEVRREALEAVGTLHFNHAFDPLQRIFRGSSEASVRRRALESIGKIHSREAVEMLIDVLRQGSPEERAKSRDLLARSDNGEVNDLLQRAAEAETGPIADAIAQIRRQRGA